MRTGGQRAVQLAPASMKVPPKRKGNQRIASGDFVHVVLASMKVPPKRKGNATMDKPKRLLFVTPQ